MPNINWPRLTSYEVWVSDFFTTRDHTCYCGLVRRQNVEEYQWVVYLTELLWNACSVCVICANVAANCVLLETHGRRGYKWQEKEFTVIHLPSRKGTCNMKCIGHETWKILINDLQNLSKFKTVRMSCVRRIRPTCTLCIRPDEWTRMLRTR